ncbi:hypothetical protein ES288_A07G185000v1 [Gossypium darwinii]|nr:hypothetical protein ES288_A07G185000v1 [Gossypium darwinii]
MVTPSAYTVNYSSHISKMFISCCILIVFLYPKLSNIMFTTMLQSTEQWKRKKERNTFSTNFLPIRPWWMV